MCYYPNLLRANAWQTSSDFTWSCKAGDQGIQSTAQFFSSEMIAFQKMQTGWNPFLHLQV